MLWSSLFFILKKVMRCLSSKVPPRCISGTSQAEWFLVKAKVALAAAVIRTRPSGLSGREYAEALACKLKSRDEGWRRKAQELQQEVLRLRQEVLMSRATLNAAGETPGEMTQPVLEGTSLSVLIG